MIIYLILDFLLSIFFWTHVYYVAMSPMTESPVSLMGKKKKSLPQWFEMKIYSVKGKLYQFTSSVPPWAKWESQIIIISYRVNYLRIHIFKMDLDCRASFTPWPWPWPCLHSHMSMVIKCERKELESSPV